MVDAVRLIAKDELSVLNFLHSFFFYPLFFRHSGLYNLGGGVFTYWVEYLAFDAFEYLGPAFGTMDLVASFEFDASDPVCEDPGVVAVVTGNPHLYRSILTSFGRSVLLILL